MHKAKKAKVHNTKVVEPGEKVSVFFDEQEFDARKSLVNECLVMDLLEEDHESFLGLFIVDVLINGQCGQQRCINSGASKIFMNKG